MKMQTEQANTRLTQNNNNKQKVHVLYYTYYSVDIKFYHLTH